MLLNKHLFEHQLDQELALARNKSNRLAILMVSIEELKNSQIEPDSKASISDVIEQAGRRIQTALRDSDTLALYDGETFSIILTEISKPEDAGRVCERIIKKLSLPIECANKKIELHSSIGVSTYPTDADDKDMLLQYAEKSRIIASKRDNNRYAYHSQALNKNLSERMFFEQELKMAIQTDGLRVEYEPEFNVETKEIVGLQALARFPHPTKGLLKAKDFIPMAEDFGLLPILNRWLLRKACEHISMMNQKRREPLKLSVNISLGEFLEHGFIDFVLKLADESGLGAKNLCIQFKEFALSSRYSKKMYQILKKLRKSGVDLTLNQYERGAASIKFLQDNNISRITISPQTVQEVKNKEREPRYVEAIIQACKALGIKTLVKGISCEADLQYFSKMGCAQVQGRFLCDPVQDVEAADTKLHANVQFVQFEAGQA
jgi:diguanylate cyclase (GGDEF)-like protein